MMKQICLKLRQNHNFLIKVIFELLLENEN